MFQKGKINRRTEGCISENQITEFRVILAGMTMKSLNLKASIEWPFVERLSIPEDIIELKIQYDGCLRKISILTKSCLLKLLLV